MLHDEHSQAEPHLQRVPVPPQQEDALANVDVLMGATVVREAEEADWLVLFLEQHDIVKGY